MTKQEIIERYSGQVLGALWSLIHPLFMMAIYVFLFAFVMKVKIGGTREMPLDYTTYLLAGLIPWLGFQDAMGKASTVITSNASLVKQVIFPVEILPVKSALASMVGMIFTVVVLILYVVAKHGYLHLTILLVPVLLFFQVLAMIGVSYALSAAGAYFRDMKDFVQMFCLAGLFLMPAFYLPEHVPAALRPILYINPFSYLTWCYQDAFYFGRMEHPWAWVILIVLSVGTLFGGYYLFQRLRVMFGNVL